MSHRSNDERLSAWLDGELSAEERRSVDAMLVESPELQDELDALRQVSELVKGMPRTSAPSSLHAAIMDEVRLSAVRPALAPAQRGARRAARLFVAAASLAVVAVGANLYFLNPTGSGQNTAAVEEIVTASRPGVQQASRIQQASRTAQTHVAVESADLNDAAIESLVEMVSKPSATGASCLSVLTLSVNRADAGAELREHFSTRGFLVSGDQTSPSDAATASATINTLALEGSLTEIADALRSSVSRNHVVRLALSVHDESSLPNEVQAIITGSDEPQSSVKAYAFAADSAPLQKLRSLQQTAADHAATVATAATVDLSAASGNAASNPVVRLVIVIEPVSVK